MFTKLTNRSWYLH